MSTLLVHNPLVRHVVCWLSGSFPYSYAVWRQTYLRVPAGKSSSETSSFSNKQPNRCTIGTKSIIQYARASLGIFVRVTYRIVCCSLSVESADTCSSLLQAGSEYIINMTIVIFATQAGQINTHAFMQCPIHFNPFHVDRLWIVHSRFNQMHCSDYHWIMNLTVMVQLNSMSSIGQLKNSRFGGPFRIRVKEVKGAYHGTKKTEENKQLRPMIRYI